MNDSYIQRNEKWMEFKEDYLNMVTSPDFQNICVSYNIDALIDISLK